jgi:hypothetical protein
MAMNLLPKVEGLFEVETGEKPKKVGVILVFQSPQWRLNPNSALEIYYSFQLLQIQGFQNNF